MGGNFTPETVHDTISQIKEYFYEAFKGTEFPLVTINKLYGIITTQTTWRMTNVNVVYSEELIKIGKWYPLHTKVTIDLKSTTQIEAEGKPYTSNGPLGKPDISWY